MNSSALKIVVCRRSGSLPDRPDWGPGTARKNITPPEGILDMKPTMEFLFTFYYLLFTVLI
ncbi:MAG: hypothetical protein NTY64_06180, partial [Deltaproteobacteria bacterium]|nr:hypothetical protein [Deltaproteobacteria bacterium]